MRPDMRMFTYDPETKTVKVDHGFNLPLPPQPYYPQPYEFLDRDDSSSDGEE
jgi:hypothetical protein